MVEKEIKTCSQGWKEQEFMATILKDANEIKEGKQKAFSLAEVKENINTLRKME